MRARLNETLVQLQCEFHDFSRWSKEKFLENSPRTMLLFHFCISFSRLFGIGLSQPDSHVCNCKLFIHVSTIFHFPMEGKNRRVLVKIVHRYWTRTGFTCYNLLNF